jgi:uncharacterized membrane protein YgdD (TMEM256/DUF423 family)
MNRLARVLIVLAGIMGADGVILAASSAHQADASRLGAASSMLLFHACAVLATVALAERALIHAWIGIAAAIGFVIAAALFAGDLYAAPICRPRPVPDGGADGRHAPDCKLAGAGDRGGVAPPRVTGLLSGHFAPCPAIG